MLWGMNIRGVIDLTEGRRGEGERFQVGSGKMFVNMKEDENFKSGRSGFPLSVSFKR